MSQFDYGGGGGGYMAGSPYGSASGSPGAVKKVASHSLRPVTIKQLLNATQAHTDAEWLLEGAEIGQVTVVAHVVSISNQTTNNVYWLDDGTGRIEARHWIDVQNEGDDDDNNTGGVVENVYVRAFGGIKSFGNKRYLNLSHIRPLKDSHEIFFHLLEAITVTLIFSRGPPGDPSQPQHGHASNGASAYTAQAHNPARNEQYAHLPPLQRKIVEFMLNQPSTGEGIHIAAIARGVVGDPAEINTAIETLMDEGHVFSTVDESHYSVSI